MDHIARGFELPIQKVKLEFEQLRRAVRDDYARTLTTDDRRALLVLYQAIVDNVANQSSGKERQRLSKVIERDAKCFKRFENAPAARGFLWAGWRRLCTPSRGL